MTDDARTVPISVDGLTRRPYAPASPDLDAQPPKAGWRTITVDIDNGTYDWLATVASERRMASVENAAAMAIFYARQAWPEGESSD